MKNILYIGQYKDPNGFGASCRRYIDMLRHYDDQFNLCIRPVFVTRSVAAPYLKNNNYTEYETNKCHSYDTLIQQVYPAYLEYNKNFGKNIAITEIETSNIKHSGWIDKLNMMDEVWVGSRFSAKSLISSGLTTAIRIIPDPYNIKLYDNTPNDFFDYSALKNKPSIFYSIGQYGEKKNIRGLLMAYLSEFTKDDNVKLFIKTYDNNRPNEELEKIIKYDMTTIKNILRKDPESYPDVDVVCGYLSDADIRRIHKSSNCYINVARGESFPASSVEAAISGNIVINTKSTGSESFFYSQNSIFVDSMVTNVTCSNSPIKNMYTINEFWFEPIISSIRVALRQFYHMTEEEKQEKLVAFDKNLFSYDSVVKLL